MINSVMVTTESIDVVGIVLMIILSLLVREGDELSRGLEGCPWRMQHVTQLHR